MLSFVRHEPPESARASVHKQSEATVLTSIDKAESERRHKQVIRLEEHAIVNIRPHLEHFPFTVSLVLYGEIGPPSPLSMYDTLS